MKNVIYSYQNIQFSNRCLHSKKKLKANFHIKRYLMSKIIEIFQKKELKNFNLRLIKITFNF